MSIHEKYLAILLLLRRIGEGSISDISNHFSVLKENTSTLAFPTARNTISSRLKDLLGSGYLSEKKIGPTKLYRLTEAGRQALEEFAATETGQLRIQILELYIKEYLEKASKK